MAAEPSLVLRVLFGLEAICWGLLVLMQVANLFKRKGVLLGMVVIGLAIAAPFFICSGIGAFHGRGVVSGLAEGWLSWGAFFSGLVFRPVLWLLALLFGMGMVR